MALDSYVTHNPSSPIHLVSDGGDDLADLAKKFHCSYVREAFNVGRARKADATANQFIWLQRIYRACQTTFAEVDWIVLLESDVECLRSPAHPPRYSLAGGRNGPAWTPPLRTLLAEKFGQRVRNGGLGMNYIGCGGSIFHKERFIHCLERTDLAVFEEAQQLDLRILGWTDATICFLFQFNGWDTGDWEDYGRHDDPDRERRAFVHGSKRFYNKPLVL